MKKAIFLDRDGTINVEKNYLYRIEDFEFLPGVIDALRQFQSSGFSLVIITNQSGIARGYYTEQDLQKLHEWMTDRLKAENIAVAAVYYCPHHPQARRMQYRQNCTCRKPAAGLFWQAAKELDIDFQESYAIGDRLRDCAVCGQTSCRGFLVGQQESPEIIKAVRDGKIPNVQYAKDLPECAEIICKER